MAKYVIEICKGKGKQPYHWRLCSGSNGKILASGETHPSLPLLHKALNRFLAPFFMTLEAKYRPKEKTYDYSLKSYRLRVDESYMKVCKNF